MKKKSVTVSFTGSVDLETAKDILSEASQRAQLEGGGIPSN